MAESDNILVRLHRWARRQDENFTTEAFVHLLQYLLEHEPRIGVGLLHFLTNGIMSVPPKQARDVRIRTQVTTSQGRPDVEIRSAGYLVYLESKVESVVGNNQLERYREELKRSGIEKTSLVLLVRYPVSFKIDSQLPDKTVRWHQLAGWMECELASNPLTDDVGRFIVDQFVDFLRSRGMTMQKVSSEMVCGAQALRNFTAMLAEAAEACKVWPNHKAHKDGILFYLEGQKYFLWLGYDESDRLYFTTYQIQLDPNTAEAAGKGCFSPSKSALGGFQWETYLDFGDVGFFTQAREQQSQILETFIRDCITFAGRLELAKPTGQ